MPARAPADRSVCWGAGLTGFALAGFFDGVLLHQILQWHHLLSGVDGPGLADLRTQVLADGLFHAAMYAIGAGGLALLWRGRRAPADGRAIAGWGLTGFAAWHIADAVLAHWIFGLHRIRMDSAAPLLWDIGWLIPFGIAPLIAGVLLLRGPLQRGGRTPARALTIAICAAAGASLWPQEGPVVALFPRGDAHRAFAAIAAADARVVWADASQGVWVIAAPKGGAALYAHGAQFVSGTVLPAGCSAALRAE